MNCVFPFYDPQKQGLILDVAGTIQIACAGIDAYKSLSQKLKEEGKVLNEHRRNELHKIAMDYSALVYRVQIYLSNVSSTIKNMSRAVQLDKLPGTFNELLQSKELLDLIEVSITLLTAIRNFKNDITQGAVYDNIMIGKVGTGVLIVGGIVFFAISGFGVWSAYAATAAAATKAGAAAIAAAGTATAEGTSVCASTTMVGTSATFALAGSASLGAGVAVYLLSENNTAHIAKVRKRCDAMQESCSKITQHLLNLKESASLDVHKELFIKDCEQIQEEIRNAQKNLENAHIL